MNQRHEYLISKLKELGFNPNGKTFEEMVELMINEYIEMCKELQSDHRESFKKEIKRLLKPTN